jgi:hypothetical protein
MGANFSCLGGLSENTVKNVTDVKLFNPTDKDLVEDDLKPPILLPDDCLRVQNAIRGYLSRKALHPSLYSLREARAWFRIDEQFPASEKPLAELQHALVSMLEANLPPLSLPSLSDGIKVQKKPALKLADGSIYEGHWSKDGKQHGSGTIITADGAKITGCFKEGVLEGNGRMIQSTGLVFEGEFREGKLNGQGKIMGNHGGKFDGTMVDGKLHGEGVEEWPDGMRYEGGYKDGLRSGTGKLWCGDGDVYEGEFVEDKMHGNGKFVWKNGNRYVGQWKEGKMHGRGVFEWSDGRKYEGQFEDDEKSGEGKMNWTDGKEYEGGWVKNKQHGVGRYKFLKENKFVTREGVWENGSRVKWIN